MGGGVYFFHSGQDARARFIASNFHIDYALDKKTPLPLPFAAYFEGNRLVSYHSGSGNWTTDELVRWAYGTQQLALVSNAAAFESWKLLQEGGVVLGIFEKLCAEGTSAFRDAVQLYRHLPAAISTDRLATAAGGGHYGIYVFMNDVSIRFPMSMPQTSHQISEWLKAVAPSDAGTKDEI